MRNILQIIGVLLILIGAMATPIAIGVGVYDWAIVDMEFKLALWEGLKTWLSLLVLGFGFGGAIYFFTK